MELSSAPCACPKSARFRLDQERLASHLIVVEESCFGINSRHRDSFAAAVAERFQNALEANAIEGPDGFSLALYTVHGDGLLAGAIVYLDSPRPVDRDATFFFAPEEVACFGDERFDECCQALRQILRRANDLLPGLQERSAAPLLPAA